RILKLDLPAQQVGHDLPQLAVLSLQRSHDVRPTAPCARAPAGDVGDRPGRAGKVELAPAMKRHDADAQRLGDLALRLAGGRQQAGLLEAWPRFRRANVAWISSWRLPDIDAGLFVACPRVWSGSVAAPIVRDNKRLTQIN